MAKVECPKCGLEMGAEQAGRRIACTACGEMSAAAEPGELPVARVEPLGYQTPAGKPPANALATAGLVFGLLGFCTGGVAGLPGLVCSILGLNKAYRDSLSRGVAIAGLIVSCLSLALLVGLILRTTQPNSSALQVNCMSNLRTIGQGILMYESDHAAFPPGVVQISEELGAPDGAGSPVLVCPGVGNETRKVDGVVCSYTLVRWPVRSSAIPGAMSEVVAFESPKYHKKGNTCVLFADGHVEVWKPTDPGMATISALIAAKDNQASLAAIAASGTQPVWARVAAISEVLDQRLLRKLAETEGEDANVTGAARARLEELRVE